MTNPLVRAGEQVHFYESMTVPTGDDFGVVVKRGDTITVTDALIEAGLDRNGESWLDYVGDDEGQLDRWKVVKYRPGPFPADESIYVHGSPDWQDAREQARQKAWTIVDPEERRAARKALERDFGPALSTVLTLRETR